MADLNPDVLTQIFLNLRFIDRVRLETVCHMWHLVLQRNACFSDMRRLNIADFLSNTTADYYQQESISLAPTIMGVVERCGAYVNSLSFGSRWLKVSQEVVDCISNHCGQLLEVDLGAVILNADVSLLLLNVADQLRVLSLEETSWVHNEHAEKMADVLCRFSRLESINLRSAMFSIENIVYLPSTLRKIDMSHAHRFSEQAMIDFIVGHPNLETITASPCPVMSQGIMDALADLKNLRYLELGYIDDRTINMSSIAQVTSLRTLHLQNVSCINESSLSSLLTSLTNLYTLNLRRCDRILDYTSLAFCDKLTSLTITDSMQLSDDPLILLAGRCALRYLCISNCINVTSDGLCYALSHCQLQQLLVTFCPMVTDDVMFALASTQDSINTISIERCIRITSKGVAALGWLRNVRQLKSMDISKNRQIDDMAVLSLHNALTLARRPAPCLSASDTDCHKARKKRGTSPPKEQSLTLYVAQTSVSAGIEQRVKDLIQLVY